MKNNNSGPYSQKFGNSNPVRGPSPSNPSYYESPSRTAGDTQDYQNSMPLNINIRNNLLEQISTHYEENYRQSSHTHNQSQERSVINHSPYGHRDNTSVSPNRRDPYQEGGIEETIQGNIDGGMTSQQIKNKKAYVWAFGKNQEGELALGVYKDALLPRFVTGLKGLNAKWISSSNHHTALITQDGQLVVSGSSLHGKLGIEGLNKTNINKFQIVPALQRKKAKQVACGDYHTLCLLEDGTVYQFGGSLFKDKKDKIARPQSQPQNVPPYVPQPVQSLYGRDIIQIDCGDFHSAALDANGDLYTWGGGAPSYNKGQCGHGHTNAIEYPEKVKYLAQKRIVKIACGGFHTLALTSENELFAFGSGCYGECGYGEFYDTSKPKLVKFPNDHLTNGNNVTDDLEEYGHNQEFVLDMYLKEQPMIADIAAGGRHSLVLTNRGRLFSFGYGSNGQLGLKNTSNYAKPQLIKDIIGKNIIQVAAGWNHSIILTERGDVYTCGYGAHGQLGHGDKESKTSFTYVANLGNKNVGKVFAGGNHTWIVLDQVIPVRDQWAQPSPLRNEAGLDNSRSLSNTPIRNISDFANNPMNKTSQTLANSYSKPPQSKPFAPLSNDNSPFNKRSLNDAQKSLSSATFGGLASNNNNNNNNSSFNNQAIKQQKQQPAMTSSSASLVPQGSDDFIQKIIEIQHQQLMKAQYFVQLTYCETEYCHRFVNFEVHGQFVKQFESMLEEYIQQSYYQEKGILYHKVQEVPQEFLTKKQAPSHMTPGEKLLKDQQQQNNDGLDYSRDYQYSDLDDSFTPEENFKGYTLCVICNPNLCGYDEQFQEWKRTNGFNSNKAKKIVVNSSSFQGSTTPTIKAVSGVGDENQAPLIGKIVFLKDNDIDNNQFEEQMSRWTTNFHRKLAKYCIKKPRYSELRPMKFSLT